MQSETPANSTESWGNALGVKLYIPRGVSRDLVYDSHPGRTLAAVSFPD